MLDVPPLVALVAHKIVDVGVVDILVGGDEFPAEFHAGVAHIVERKRGNVGTRRRALCAENHFTPRSADFCVEFVEKPAHCLCLPSPRDGGVAVVGGVAYGACATHILVEELGEVDFLARLNHQLFFEDFAAALLRYAKRLAFANVCAVPLGALALGPAHHKFAQALFFVAFNARIRIELARHCIRRPRAVKPDEVPRPVQ